ncbi:Uncharacterised protein [Bordetella pertussis]|nr:Uncharacterised protein [Bordetella pertussis]
MPLGGIGAGDAGRARVAEDGQAVAGQMAAAQQQLRAHDQAARVGHAQDAMLAEPGVQRLVLGGDGAGVRLRGLQALRRNAGLQGQHGHLARTRQRGRARQGGGRGQAFHVEQDQPDFGVAQHRLGEVRDVEVAFVAGGDRVAHADAFGAQVRVRDHAHRAALADDGHRPVGGGNLAQQGGEGRQGAVAEIGQALGVRPQQAHAGRRGGRLHVLLRLPSGFAALGRHRGRLRQPRENRRPADQVHAAARLPGPHPADQPRPRPGPGHRRLAQPGRGERPDRHAARLRGRRGRGAGRAGRRAAGRARMRRHLVRVRRFPRTRTR